jgi:hypothetical protein
MFENFNPSAIKVMLLAQEEARRLGHNFVGTEQILLGLIGEGTGASEILKSMGMNLKDTRAEIENIIGRGSGFVAVEIPFTPRGKRVLKLSQEERLNLEHNYIGTEHLLLGLIREGEGVAIRALGNFGIDISELRAQAMRKLVSANLKSEDKTVTLSLGLYVMRQALTVGRLTHWVNFDIEHLKQNLFQIRRLKDITIYKRCIKEDTASPFILTFWEQEVITELSELLDDDQPIPFYDGWFSLETYEQINKVGTMLISRSKELRQVIQSKEDAVRALKVEITGLEQMLSEINPIVDISSQDIILPLLTRKLLESLEELMFQDETDELRIQSQKLKRAILFETEYWLSDNNVFQLGNDQFIAEALNTPLPSHLQLLPQALFHLHRLGIYPPLSLVQDLLVLTSDQPLPAHLVSLPNTIPGITKLAALRWSESARIGLVALLLHKLPISGWDTPQNTPLSKISKALRIVLNGEAVVPEVPPLPITLLEDAAKQIDDRLISLLTILGSQAIEVEPGLPIRLLPKVRDLPVLSSKQRQLIGLNVYFSGTSGQSIGRDPGADRGQVSGVETARRTDWNALLPSQFALPKTVLDYRYAQGELLYRSREVAEPPRLRPVVLLLDVTPPVFGPVEAVTRTAAFIVARSLQQVGFPVALVTTGDGQEQVTQLELSANLVEIWTQRSLLSANVSRSLRIANAVRSSFQDESGLEPIILLLTHPWFGAETDVLSTKGLRGLFVQYPSQRVQPVLAGICDRWQSLSSGQTSNLEQILGYLIS